MTSPDAPRDALPRPVIPGPKMTALLKFHPDVTWTGTIEENGMGPGSPRMHATGQGLHQVIQDGLWVVGDYSQDQFLEDGTFVLKWELHWVAGWDETAAEYRAIYADNFGHAGVMRGTIDENRLRFESLGDAAVRIRLIWQRTSGAEMSWTNEISIGDGPWSLVETYRLTPTPASEDRFRG